MKKAFQIIGICTAIVAFLAAVAAAIWYFTNKYALCDCCEGDCCEDDDLADSCCDDGHDEAEPF